MTISNEQYNDIAKALLAKGYTVDTVYPALEAAGFQVTLKRKTYEGIYVSRIIAIMHKTDGDKAPLKL